MRGGLCRTSVESFLGAFLLALPSIAMAQSSGETVAGHSQSAATLTINVTASVSPSCSFSSQNMPSGTYSVGDVEAAYSLDVGFSLRCNAPSRVGIVSDHGGLQAPGLLAPPPGYARLAPYQITLRLVGDGGTSAQATCQSPNLVAGSLGCVFRGPATAMNGLRLSGPSGDSPGSFIRISSRGYSDPATLIASNSYSDRLTVTISPAI
jgi:hypothetical protein